MERSMQTIQIFCALLLAPFGILVPLVAPALPTAAPEADRLMLGEFEYLDTLNGSKVGGSRIRVARSSNGNYQFNNEVTGEADQAWTARCAKDFAPQMAQLSFGTPDGRKPLFELNYEPGRVKGFFMQRQGAERVRVAVDAAVSKGIIDQRIDWAAVMAASNQVGQRFSFEVYDPGIGTSLATAVVQRGPQLPLRGSPVPTLKIVYRINKSSGAETYVVFASEKLPRIMLREDFPDGTRSELQGFKPIPEAD
jgi:hypothetical protein